MQPLQQASVCKRGCLPNYTTLACDHSWVVNWTAADDVSLFTTEPSPHPYFVEDNITYYGNLALSPEKIGEGVTFGAEFLGGGFTPLVHPTDANNLPTASQSSEYWQEQTYGAPINTSSALCKGRTIRSSYKAPTTVPSRG